MSPKVLLFRPRKVLREKIATPVVLGAAEEAVPAPGLLTLEEWPVFWPLSMETPASSWK